MKDPEGYFVRKSNSDQGKGQLKIERDFPKVVLKFVLPRIFYYEQSALFVFSIL